MANIVVIGAQWGDEGKGKIVDFLSRPFDGVARFQGGENAGHTVKIRDQEYSFHLIPSGILRKGKRCFLGNGMVINPGGLLAEISTLKELGIDVERNLAVSKRAQVVMPYHFLLDRSREESDGEQKIGTTGKGIGPAYETKMRRAGVLMADLVNQRILQQKVEAGIKTAKALTPESHGVRELSMEAICEEYGGFGQRLQPLLGDVARIINEMADKGQSLLFEGAQGTLLDIDHGTYPYVTSSNCFAGGVCTGIGISPRRIDGVLGVFKAYCTRVGEGPFPTELNDETGEAMRERGHEYGTTTGRPRRCGWFDGVAARYSAAINAFDAVAVTLLDVLDAFDEVKICTGYKVNSKESSEFPSDAAILESVEPIYETLPGWATDTTNMTSLKDLPSNAIGYLERLSEIVGCEIALVSVGATRQATLINQDLAFFSLLPGGHASLLSEAIES